MHFHTNGPKVHCAANRANGVLCDTQPRVRRLWSTSNTEKVTCKHCIDILYTKRDKKPSGPQGRIYSAQLRPRQTMFLSGEASPVDEFQWSLYEKLCRKADRFGQLRVVQTDDGLYEPDSGVPVPANFLDSGLKWESERDKTPKDVLLRVTQRDVSGVHIFPGILQKTWNEAASGIPNYDLGLNCLMHNRMKDEFDLLWAQSNDGKLKVRVSWLDEQPYIYLGNTGWVIEEGFLENSSMIIDLAKNPPDAEAGRDILKTDPELAAFIENAVRKEVDSQLSKMKREPEPHSPKNADVSVRHREGAKKQRGKCVSSAIVYSKLPEGEFTLDDAARVFPQCPKSTLRKRLSRFVQKDWIERLDYGVFKKPKSQDEPRADAGKNTSLCPGNAAINCLRVDLVSSWDEALRNLNRMVNSDQDISKGETSLANIRKRWLLLQSTHRLETVPVRLQEGGNPFHKDLIYWDTGNSVPWFLVDMASPVTQKAIREAKGMKSVPVSA